MTQNKLKILFFGGRILGKLCLNRLSKANVDCLAVSVITQNPDGDPASDWNPPLTAIAEQHSYCVYKPLNLKNSSSIEMIKSINPDIIFSCFYDKIIPEEILKLPKYGAINFHYGKLPNYRGRFIVSHMILNGETTAIVTAHYMTSEPDAGDIIFEEPVIIKPDWTARELYFACADAGAQIFTRILQCLLIEKKLPRKKQEGWPTYYRFEEPNRCEVDLRWTQQKIERFIRGLTFKPVSCPYLIINGERYNIQRKDI